jgi:hypothetical protein
MIKKRGRPPKKHINPHFYVKTYECAKDGLSKKEIAKSLGVNFTYVFHWLKIDPAFKEAFDKGRAARGTTIRQKFSEYVYKHLPENLHDLWSQICAADDPGGGGEAAIQRLTKDCGRRTRQYIWVHALVSGNFNYNEACRRSGISRVMVQRWMEGDPDFADLIQHIHEMKKDFVEGCLMNLVGQGDSAATIFSAKTLLRDRGFDPKLTIEHKGSVTHTHVSLETVLTYLPIETKRQVLEAMRQAAEGAEPPKMLMPAQQVEEFEREAEDIEDAEFEEMN